MIDIEKVLDKLAIEELNSMQIASIREFRDSSKDIIILSPTGSGKTYAYLFPLLNIIDSSKDEIQAAVIVPGRELAMQLSNVFNDLKSGIKTMSLYGGRPAMEEHRQLKTMKPQIVFATPGRLNDHICKNNINTKYIRHIVLDEFDKCLEMGFQSEMEELFNKMPFIKRRILVSATPSNEIPKFVNLSSSVCLDFLDDSEQVPKRISVNIVKSDNIDKADCLSQLLCSFKTSSSIVFLNFRDSVERIAQLLRNKGFIISKLHGGMSQQEREAHLYRFYNGSTNILVATDLASRGLDIPNIDNIVHYHLPLNKEAYIHRVGRSARWDKKGNSFFILNEREVFPDFIDSDAQDYVISAEDYQPSKPNMTTIYVGKGKKDRISKADIVGFLCKKGGLTADDIGRIDVKERYTYVAVARTKTQQMLQKISGEKIKGIKTIVEIIR